MRVFLIRHGETVDNVAGLYAGSRDSELTNHGVQQAIRLGAFFKSSGIKFTHLFSSHLRRAYKTAEYVREGQRAVQLSASEKEAEEVPAVVRLPILMEQDFGSLEGVSFIKRPNDLKSGKQAHAEAHKDDPNFVKAESKEALCKRADEFIDHHLLPLVPPLEDASKSAPESSQEPVIAIVSHGIMLSVLWRRLLRRIPNKSITVHPDILAKGPVLDLERLGGWSNTGFLQLELKRSKLVPAKTEELTKAKEIKPVTTTLVEDARTASTKAETKPTSPGLSPKETFHEEPRVPDAAPKLLIGWTTTIQAINSTKHLISLKRTRGGVGSARHDDKQQKLESFFKVKKRKIG